MIGDAIDSSRFGRHGNVDLRPDPSTGFAGRYLQYRLPEVHSRARSAPYRYIAIELEKLVGRLAVTAAPAGSKVFDYGCAERPYRALFGPEVQYIGGDLPGNPSADLLLDPDGTVPVPDSQFDVVLSTQVLEHVVDPALYVAECYRILKPGGNLVITTHGLMHYHPDPDDYWRWTSPGLKRLLVAAGFDQVELAGLMGLAPAAMQLFQHATVQKLPRRARAAYVAVMQALIERADRFYSEPSRVANALVLAARAKRPAS